MDIENKLRKRIKTITIATGEYPKEIEVSKEELEELKECIKRYETTFVKNEKFINGFIFDGVRLKDKK